MVAVFCVGLVLLRTSSTSLLLSCSFRLSFGSCRTSLPGSLPSGHTWSFLRDSFTRHLLAQNGEAVRLLAGGQFSFPGCPFWVEQELRRRLWRGCVATRHTLQKLLHPPAAGGTLTISGGSSNANRPSTNRIDLNVCLPGDMPAHLTGTGRSEANS